MDVRWYAFTNDKGSSGTNPKAVIVSNQRIYIVDKNLSIIQNYQHRLIVKSISILAHTILFSTDNHLYYLTQEKG